MLQVSYDHTLTVVNCVNTQTMRGTRCRNVSSITSLQELNRAREHIKGTITRYFISNPCLPSPTPRSSYAPLSHNLTLPSHFIHRVLSSTNSCKSRWAPKAWVPRSLPHRMRTAFFSGTTFMALSSQRYTSYWEETPAGSRWQPPPSYK